MSQEAQKFIFINSWWNTVSSPLEIYFFSYHLTCCGSSKPKTQQVSVAYLLHNLPLRCWTVALDILICEPHSIMKPDSGSLRNPEAQEESWRPQERGLELMFTWLPSFLTEPNTKPLLLSCFPHRIFWLIQN